MSTDPNKLPEVIPPPSASKTERTAGAITTVSSHVDPLPHYVLAGICGTGAIFAQMNLPDKRLALGAGAIALAYLYSGVKIQSPDHDTQRFAYDVASAASLALVGGTMPMARRTKEPFPVAFATLGGISAVGNLLKGYQMRTNRPRDYQIRK